MFAGFALSAQTNAIAIIDPGRYFHRQGLMLLYPAMAMTFATGVSNHFALAVTTWTGLLQGEKTLLHTYLAHTTTGRTGCRAGALLGT
jgi:hypothetical protein